MNSGKYKKQFINNAISIKSLIFVVSFSLLPIVVQAATYQTYVIPTYGGDSLLPIVRQQLSTSQDGGTVATYQGKLVLQTSAANYQAVQQLLAQIDGQPQALTVALRVGNSTQTQDSTQQGQVIITDRSIQGAGVINQSRNQQQTNNLYQVQTLSGRAASISTGTLYSLTQHYQTNYPTYNRPAGQIIIAQQVLLPTTQGITVTPRLLSNGQVEVKLTQVEEELVKPNLPYKQGYAIQGQKLNSTIIVPRGQWVDIGQISQTTQKQSSGYGNHRSGMSSTSAPISLLVR